jgi:tetratricopeptide (TPR) repeat protein
LDRGRPDAAATAGSASGYAAELARLTSSLQWLDRRAAEQPGSWLAQAAAADAHLERARLTGDYEDYAAADALIAEAFRSAPEGAGPHLERAALNFTLHRFDRVESDLTAAEAYVLVDDPARAAIVGLRADVALQQGREAEALQGFETALRLHPTPQGWARLANWYKQRGDQARAEESYRKSAELDHGTRDSRKAWIHLQLGLMDLAAGRLDAALAHYRDAEAVFPGWWLVEEHIAEVLALQGHLDVAEGMYIDLARRTSDPEFMDALARICRTRGDEKRARRWIVAARRNYEQRLARFPEASWGHALRHFLEFGDPGIAVGLAEKNWQLRPNRESRDLLVRAYEKSGRVEAARGLQQDPARPAGAL